jgi:hypothetical protein
MRRLTLAAIVVGSLTALLSLAAACSDADAGDADAPKAGDTSKPASTSSDAAHAPSAGKIITAPGFTYDPDDLTPGFPDVTTIRLGDRIRIWSRAATDWFPMTIALLDEHGISMTSFRLDVPPAGSITGALPDTPRPCKKIRITQCIAPLADPGFTRRIGTQEPELTTITLRDQRIISKDREKHPDPKVDPSDPKKIIDAAITASETELLQELFGRPVILDGDSIYFSGSDPWKTRPVPDDEWLDRRIQAYLTGVSNRRRVTSP